MAINISPETDIRNVMSGSDGGLYDADDGTHLATVESFQAQVSVTNQSYQPLGTSLERSRMTSHKITLTFTEVVVTSGMFFEKIINGLKDSNLPSFNFRGAMINPNKKEEQVIYRNCVPDGTIDIQNMQVGQLYKRNWSFVCNSDPDVQTYMK